MRKADGYVEVVERGVRERRATGNEASPTCRLERHDKDGLHVIELSAIGATLRLERALARGDDNDDTTPEVSIADHESAEEARTVFTRVVKGYVTQGWTIVTEPADAPVAAEPVIAAPSRARPSSKRCVAPRPTIRRRGRSTRTG